MIIGLTNPVFSGILITLGGIAFLAFSTYPMENKPQLETVNLPPSESLGASWVASLFGIMGSGALVVGLAFGLRTIAFLVTPVSSNSLSYLS